MARPRKHYLAPATWPANPYLQLNKSSPTNGKAQATMSGIILVLSVLFVATQAQPSQPPSSIQWKQPSPDGLSVVNFSQPFVVTFSEYSAWVTVDLYSSCGTSYDNQKDTLKYHFPYVYDGTSSSFTLLVIPPENMAVLNPNGSYCLQLGDRINYYNSPPFYIQQLNTTASPTTPASGVTYAGSQPTDMDFIRQRTCSSSY